ncbi:MAG: hypothetical protein ACRCX8_05800 [Sarcina sp.]
MSYADKHQNAYNGFDTESLKENKLTYIDSLYIKHMKAMCDKKGLETITYEGETYTWIDQTKMAEYLDLLGGLRNLQKRIAYFVEVGLFKKHTINRKNGKNGKYSYFCTTEKLCSMVRETRVYESYEQNSVESHEQNSQSHTNKIRKGYEQNSVDLTNKIRNKDSFNKDSINKTNNKKSAPSGVDFNFLINTYTTNPVIADLLNKFVETRKEIKVPFTERAFTTMLSKLSDISSNDKEKAAILKNSVSSGYRSVFPLNATEKKIANEQPEQQMPQEQSQEEDGNEMYITPDGVITKYTKDYIKSDLVETRWDENDRTKVAYYGIDPNNLSGGYRRLDI